MRRCVIVVACLLAAACGDPNAAPGLSNESAVVVIPPAPPIPMEPAIVVPAPAPIEKPAATPSPAPIPAPAPVSDPVELPALLPDPVPAPDPALPAAPDPAPPAPAPVELPPAPVIADPAPPPVVVVIDPTPAPAAPPAPVPATAARGPIGMNLSTVAFYAAEFPFIDRMLTAGEWTASKWGGTPVAGSLALDATGFPTALPDGANSLNVAIGLDAADADTDRRYVVTWDGQMDFGAGGLPVTIEGHGRASFSSPNQIQGISFSNIDPANFVRNVHVVRADQEELLKAGALFNPAFVAASARWSALRFMDWNNTNGSTLAHWADRLTPASSSYAFVKLGDAVPIEVEVRLANEAHVDPWLTIPARADDDFVTRTLIYVRDHLDPALRVHLEFSNEVWNNGFEQRWYAQAQADALWGGEPGAANWTGGDGVPHLEGGNELYYGFRSAQVARIARPLLGDRLRMVIAVQTGWKGLEDFIFKGVARANLGTPDTLFNDYAVTTYWGDGLSGQSDADKATVLAWARGGDAGLDAAFRAIETAEGLALKDGSLDKLPGLYAYHKGVADKYGLKLIAYEGGFDPTATLFAQADRPAVVDLLNRLVADPRMSVLTRRMASDFIAGGGSVLAYFNDAGPVSQYGPWGAAASIYATSPRIDALVNIGR